MDTWIARIKELADFLADVATVWFVIRSLSGLTLRQMIARLVRRNTVIVPLTGTLRAPGGWLLLASQLDAPPVQNTVIVPLTGTLRFN